MLVLALAEGHAARALTLAAAATQFTEADQCSATSGGNSPNSIDG